MRRYYQTVRHVYTILKEMGASSPRHLTGNLAEGLEYQKGAQDEREPLTPRQVQARTKDNRGPLLRRYIT